MLRRVIPVAYLLIGILVAAQHSYFAHLNTASHVVTAVLAAVLWPLVLLGVHVTRHMNPGPITQRPLARRPSPLEAT